MNNNYMVVASRTKYQRDAMNGCFVQGDYVAIVDTQVGAIAMAKEVEGYWGPTEKDTCEGVWYWK